MDAHHCPGFKWIKLGLSKGYGLERAVQRQAPIEEGDAGLQVAGEVLATDGRSAQAGGMGLCGDYGITSLEASAALPLELLHLRQRHW